MRAAPVTRHPIEILTGSVDGKSAYEVAVDNGFVGTEEDWLESLKGEPGVDGIAALRALAPVNGKTVQLNYHTTPDDLGSGYFRGVTTGSFTDDNGTVVVPGGAAGSTAWLRVWDGVTAHVGWFGAVCDLVTDDYNAAAQCLRLFSVGRLSLRTGVMDIGPGFAFSQPLIYAATANGYGLKIKGSIGLTRGSDQQSALIYTGPVTLGAVVLYGTNEVTMEDLNVYPRLAYNAVVCTACNQYNTTLTASVLAGASVVASVGSTATLLIGAIVGIDIEDNFEIVTVREVNSATSFTADFAMDHANGVQVGGSGAASGWHFNRCRLMCPVSTIFTTIPLATAGGLATVFTPASMTGIEVGMPLRVGSFGISETVYVSSITGSTFTADCLQSHLAGDIVMYPTAALFFGNRMTVTNQVSEVTITDCSFFPASGTDRSYAGVRQITGGNVKNFVLNDIKYTHLYIPFAFEESSSVYKLNGIVGAGARDTILLHATGTFTVTNLQDESLAYWVRCNVGSNAAHTSFIGCTFGGGAPQTNDEVVWHSGQLTFIECFMRQNRIFGTTYPKIIMLNMTNPLLPAGLTLINCYIPYLGQTDPFVYNVSGGSGADMVIDGRYNVTMIGCKGGGDGATKVTLPTLLPPATRWQNSALYNPPNLLANTADTIQTMTVTGAALGDLVEVSFSENLGEVLLRAWVSAANTVSYQFRNPTAGALDIGSGSSTVKCRVKK